VLQAGGAAVASAFVPAAATFADEKPAPAQTPAGPLHRYSDYGWLRGFSVVPSWAARIEAAWSDYHPDRFREEVALARQVHANCVRIWIEFTAWFPDPPRVTAHFLDAVKACGELGMTAMPCLFNRWHDTKYDYGGTHVENLFGEIGPKLEYVRAVVKPLVDDPNVLIWDLCNEPQAHDLNSDVNRREYAWLEAVAATVRELGAKQPVTIGTMSGANITTYAPLCDVLCGHPYVHTAPELANLVKAYVAIREQSGKPMLVNETIPGALDDAVRAGVARFYTEQLAAAGLGWMGWALREGKAISTRRDRFDANGINGQGFHPWFTADGKLRGGLEFLTEPSAERAPWQK
jgi:hypothetical protein